MSDMQAYRAEIDRIDAQLIALFEERMQVARAIGSYKASRGMPVFDEEREKEKLLSVRAAAKDARSADELERFFRAVMEISRDAQEELRS
jgi:monofunctional chorismate mutase